MYLTSREHSVENGDSMIVMLSYAWNFPTRNLTAWYINDQVLGTCVLISTILANNNGLEHCSKSTHFFVL